jgi:sec-independent protein translocase protein TatB
MNIFSNIGITELIVILLLALLVVGPERLPEMARQLAKILRDARKAYENLTSDLGPEIASIQQTTLELRESVESVRSIPQHMVQSVAEAADLQATFDDLKDVTDSVGQVGQTLAGAGQVIKDPVNAAVGAAQSALRPSISPGEETMEEEAADAAPADLELQEAADATPAIPEEPGPTEDPSAEQADE